MEMGGDALPTKQDYTAGLPRHLPPRAPMVRGVPSRTCWVYVAGIGH